MFNSFFDKLFLFARRTIQVDINPQSRTILGTSFCTVIVEEYNRELFIRNLFLITHFEYRTVEISTSTFAIFKFQVIE